MEKNKEYLEYVKTKSPNSPVLRHSVLAFLVGGSICLLGQVINDVYLYFGAQIEVAAAATSVTLIFLSALFTGLGYYDKLAAHAGAGTLVPITGFANAVVSPALEFKHEGFIMGTCAKMFTIAGPVLVLGISSAIVYGFILYLLKICGVM